MRFKLASLTDDKIECRERENERECSEKFVLPIVISEFKSNGRQQGTNSYYRIHFAQFSILIFFLSYLNYKKKLS